MGVERLYPDPQIMVEEVYGDLILPKENQDDSTLPHVILNMVSSIDGKISSGGKSGAIGSDVDRKTMRVLRSKADAVMVGAGTLRAERVSLSSEGRRSPEPKAIISTNSLDLPLENLVVSGDQKAYFLIPKNSDPEKMKLLSGKAKLIECERSTDGESVDLEKALRKLKAEYRAGSLLLEGGPGLNQAFVSQGLVSELMLTLSPKLLGGSDRDSMGMLSDANLLEKELTLLSIYRDHRGELFLRYRFNFR